MPEKSPTAATSTVGSSSVHLCPCISSISEDKDKVNALYSPFRPKEANPESYAQKMKFWSKAVEEYVTFGSRLSFTLKELQKAFRIENRVPACLDEVVGNASQNRVILTEAEFYDFLKSSSSWVAWSQVSIKKVLSSTMNLVPGMKYFISSSGEVRFIHISQLKEQVETLTSKTTLANKLISVVRFQEEVKTVLGITDLEDIEFLQAYLISQKRLSMDKVGHEDVVVIAKVGEKQGDISVVAKGKYDVHRTMEILENQLTELHEKVTAAENNARKALKQGKRNTAKHELKRKKLFEQRVDKLLNMVDNLSVITMKIEDAESDATMLVAYEAGKKALSGILEDKNLTVDRVTEAMLDMQDLLDTQADISAAVSQPMEGQDDIAELESELDMLLKEDEEKGKLELPIPAKKVSSEEEKELEALKMLDNLNFGDDLTPNLSSGKGLSTSLQSDT